MATAPPREPGVEPYNGWSRNASGVWVWNDGPKLAGETDQQYFDRMMAAKRKTNPTGKPLRDTTKDYNGWRQNPGTGEWVWEDGPKLAGETTKEHFDRMMMLKRQSNPTGKPLVDPDKPKEAPQPDPGTTPTPKPTPGSTPAPTGSSPIQPRTGGQLPGTAATTGWQQYAGPQPKPADFPTKDQYQQARNNWLNQAHKAAYYARYKDDPDMLGQYTTLDPSYWADIGGGDLEKAVAAKIDIDEGFRRAGWGPYDLMRALHNAHGSYIGNLWDPNDPAGSINRIIDASTTGAAIGPDGRAIPGTEGTVRYQGAYGLMQAGAMPREQLNPQRQAQVERTKQRLWGDVGFKPSAPLPPEPYFDNPLDSAKYFFRGIIPPGGLKYKKADGTLTTDPKEAAESALPAVPGSTARTSPATPPTTTPPVLPSAPGGATPPTTVPTTPVPGTTPPGTLPSTVPTTPIPGTTPSSTLPPVNMPDPMTEAAKMTALNQAAKFTPSQANQFIQNQPGGAVALTMATGLPSVGNQAAPTTSVFGRVGQQMPLAGQQGESDQQKQAPTSAFPQVNMTQEAVPTTKVQPKTVTLPKVGTGPDTNRSARMPTVQV